ncbi:MAG: hypothetical protein V1754_06805 [Pseudomonadota bacterium]
MLLCACGTEVFPSEDGQAQDDSGVPVTDSVLPPDSQSIQESGTTLSIGAPCDVNSGAGCKSEEVCLDVGQNKGVCALPGCTMEDITTSLPEDDCPSGAACVRVAVNGGVGGEEEISVCVPTCKPSSVENPCAKFGSQLSCDPRSIFLTGYAEVCLFPACVNDSDCPGASVLDPGAADCDQEIGVCFTNGTPGGDISSPCLVSKDCGKGQVCFRAQSTFNAQNASQQGTPDVVGGYCTIVGCSYGGLWECPSNSSCFYIGSTQDISLCLAIGCDASAPEEKDGCRDETPGGPYSCLSVEKQSVCWLKPE